MSGSQMSLKSWTDKIGNQFERQTAPIRKENDEVLYSRILESIGETDAIAEYELREVTVNVLNVERTFIDKVMSVKRHALSGTLSSKVRHIYDVVRLYQLPEIQQFLQNKIALKSIVRITKETDVPTWRNEKSLFSLIQQRHTIFNFGKNVFLATWKSYELPASLLYSDTPQNWDEALAVFEQIEIAPRNRSVVYSVAALRRKSSLPEERVSARFDMEKPSWLVTK